jgi:citrate lyase subunit beta/citryl-CoA lyase
MGYDASQLPDLELAIATATDGARSLQQQVASGKSSLPLRFWRQQAHLTTPAQRDIATKALTAGTAPMARILERFDVRAADLADHLGADVSAVEELLETPRPAPLVVIDAEDALADTASATRQARVDAVEVLSAAPVGAGVSAPLRFFRPPGLAFGGTARELLTLLWGLVERNGPDALPLDGIVYPKIEHPEEVELVHDLLASAEQALGIPSGTVRTAYLVESASAAARIDEIARRAVDRLSSLIFGLADYSADLNLPSISSDHLVADWARAGTVNAAASVGVPAIDAMTLAFPVADGQLDTSANRARFLERMVQVYNDAVRARDLGMLGKWVGHPAQLFAVLLAFDASYQADVLEQEAAKLTAYAHAVQVEGKGAAMIDGLMADRATDRHARTVLRRATASGHFDAQRAVALGVIDRQELAELMPPQGQQEAPR